MELRGYQKKAIMASWKGAFDGLIVLPTGSGKSVVLSKCIDGIIYDNPQAKVLLVSHSKEILIQDHEEFRKLSPKNGGLATLYGASLGSKDLGGQVVFGQIQSLNKIDTGGVFTNIIIDEAHLIPLTDDSSYKKLFSQNSSAKLLGLTATPFRLDCGLLTEGIHGLFKEITFEAPASELISDGFLSPIVYSRGDGGLVTKGLKKTSGEYQGKAQETQLQKRIGQITSDLIEKTDSSKKVLIFCPNISFISLVIPYLPESRKVIGSTSPEERAENIEDFANGKYKYLINCGCLTTGFNVPDCDTVVLMRATTSVALYVQMVGRGMRIAPGKDSCLLLDYGNNVERFGEVTKISNVDGKPSFILCAHCRTFALRGTKKCKKCGGVEFLKRCRYCEEYCEQRHEKCPICEKPFEIVKVCDKCENECDVRALECNFCGNLFPMKIEGRSFSGISRLTPEPEEWSGVKKMHLIDAIPDKASVSRIFQHIELEDGGLPAPTSLKVNFFVLDDPSKAGVPRRIPIFVSANSEKPFARKMAADLLSALGCSNPKTNDLQNVYYFFCREVKKNLPAFINVEKRGNFYSVKGFERG